MELEGGREKKTREVIEEAILPKWKTNELALHNKHYFLFPVRNEAIEKDFNIESI